MRLSRRNSRRVGATLSGVVALTVSSAALADDWLGADKALHFGVSAAIAAGGYGVSAPFFAESRLPPLLIGGGVAAAAGIGKELYDATGRGEPSAKDLVWDAAGIAAGLLVAVGVDLLVRGPRLPSQSPQAMLPQSAWSGSAGGFTVRF